MQSHPWDADEPARPHHNDANDDSHRDLPPPADDALDVIPAPLRNWQVIEIDGEATVIRDAETAGETGADSRLADAAPRLPQDYVDTTVVAGLAATRLEARPGEPAPLTVNLLNNGRRPSLFEITLEGWIDERWCPDLPARIHLQPGERQTVAVNVNPPRSSTVAAGEHAAVVVVRAAAYPGHATRLALTLDIAPDVDIRLGALQPRHSRAGWFRRAALVHIPLSNQGNTPTTVQLSARDRDHDCDFFFYADAFAADFTGDFTDAVTGATDRQPGHNRVTLAPGAATSVAVEIRPRTRPILGLIAAPVPYRVTAHPLTPPGARQTADGRLTVTPLVGLWQLVAVAVMGVALLFGVGLAGLALLMALRATSAQVAPQAAVAPTAAPAAPVVAFVIQLGEPAPTHATQAGATQAGAGAEPTPTPPGGVPIVSADQVSAPGAPVPTGQPRLQPIAPTPVPAAAPNSAHQLTYAEMFQAVAARFDLNWRMLAAQAYVESGFDAVALGNLGALGLMQILPDTWREWAPTVDASDPFDGYSNVLVAAAYLDYLRTQLTARGYPQIEWMLVAYNWGPDKTLDFLAAGGTWATLAPELRGYAEEILRIAESIPAN